MIKEKLSFASEPNSVLFYWHEGHRAEGSLLETDLRGLVKKLEKDISKISVEQKEMFKEQKQNQSLALEQIANEQSDKLNQIYQSLEDEKSNLNEKVNVLTQKVKSLSILAGGAVALTVIQLFLNILGVI